MKLISTVDAKGHILCHDITQIIKGVTKDARFRKGHVVTEEDIPVLLSMGKENLYIWEKQEGMLHENEAAAILYELCAGENMTPSAVKEGKIQVIAQTDGLFMVDVERLRAINSLGEMIIATRHGNFPVKAGDHLAGTRIIPLLIEEEKMTRARELAGEQPLFALHPFTPKKVGLIVTGTEVSTGRIKDTFSPVIEEKLAEYGAVVLEKRLLGDDYSAITAGIEELVEKGADMVVCTGGMSVDPDDRTPLAIKNTGARVVSYGAPVLPGAMFMLAYYTAQQEGAEKICPVMGLPGCVMYAKRTIFDLVLPRVIAEQELTAEDLSALGHGGLCLSCPVCTYPNCGFGKGI